MPQPAHRLAFESYGLAAEVRSDDREMFDCLPLVLPPGWRRLNGSEVDARFGLMRDGTITRDGAEVARTGGDRTVTLAALASTLRHHLALHAPEHVFIHAGVVCAGSAAIVIPGSSFSGKTTLVAELVRAGATYYSDEYAVVDADGMIHSYPAPLSIRLPGSGRFGVPMQLPDSQIGTERVHAGLIVVTRYEDGAEWRPAACAPGEGALALLQHTVAARSKPREALVAACRLAQAARVISGPRGDASTIAGDLVALVGGSVRQHVGDPSTGTLGESADREAAR